MEQLILDANRCERCGDAYETDREKDFAEVYEMYVDDIYRLCYSFMKNQMDAEDVVQETFIKYYHSGKHFESMAHRKAWLIVTASNRCKDVLKQWWRKRESFDDLHETLSSDHPMIDEMMELVMKLPEKYKTAVYLYYYEGYDSAEIARLLHKPASTVRTYLQRARKLLKQELTE